MGSINEKKYDDVKQAKSSQGSQSWDKRDDLLQDEAHQILWRNQSVDSTEIEVQAKAGVITLVGVVDDKEMKKTAEECLKDLIGVKKIVNSLEIRKKS